MSHKGHLKYRIMSSSTILYHILPLVIYMALIWIFSSRELPDLAGIFPEWLRHSLEFGLLTFLWFRLLSRVEPSYGRLGLVIFSVSLAILYGVVDEIHQGFVPGRDLSFNDMFFDAAGALVAGGIIFIFLKAQKAKGVFDA